MNYLSLIPRRRALAPWGLDFDRIMRDFFSDTDLAPFYGEGAAGFQPKLDLAETDKEVRITAELPGLEEKDIEVSLNENTLSLKGEKKSESEEEGKNFYRRERSYGAFYREVELPAEIQAEKISATFKNGVLTVVLPKAEKSKAELKKIPVKSA